MSKRILSFMLAIMLTMASFPVMALAASPKSSVPSSWALAAVKQADGLGIIPQSLNSDFQASITRAEFCAMAVKLYEQVIGKEITTRQTFIDTSDINVQKMGSLDVVTGIGDDKFSPSGTITREQSAVILANLTKALGKPLNEMPAHFADNDDISAWALTAVGQIQAAGIMSGTGSNTFSPKANYTREQSIVTLLRVFDLTNPEVLKLESYSAKVLKLTNAERTKAGLSVFTATPLLQAAASTRANELEKKYSHNRPDGSECFSILVETGILFSAAGENIASGHETPEQVVAAWMSSDGHKANILDSNFNKLGVGVYTDENGIIYWVQLFTD